MYRYETHLHTSPASACAGASVRETLEFYKALSYDGVFITNHFLDGNIGGDRSRPYEEQVNFYFADYESALPIGKELGIKVFPGVELSYGGTDFLIYGLEKEWYLSHPQIMQMKKSEELPMMKNAGALVIQAHPYREAGYIDHIRLFPRSVEGVETVNASRTEFENRMADAYADAYGLLKTAGSDNHDASRQSRLAGVETEEPLCSVEDFIRAVREKKTHIFELENPLHN